MLFRRAPKIQGGFDEKRGRKQQLRARKRVIIATSTGVGEVGWETLARTLNVRIEQLSRALSEVHRGSTSYKVR